MTGNRHDQPVLSCVAVEFRKIGSVGKRAHSPVRIQFSGIQQTKLRTTDFSDWTDRHRSNTAPFARIDIFCAAMLGHRNVVKSLLTLHPQLANALGPHGFTLRWHAKAGKDQAKPVLEFLEEFKTKLESTTPLETKAGS